MQLYEGTFFIPSEGCRMFSHSQFGITDYDILHLNWPDFPIISALLV